MQSCPVRIALGVKLPRRSQLAVENPIPISFRIARQAHANAVEANAEFARVFASVNTEDQQRRAAILASVPVSCTSVGATTTCY